MGQSVFGCPPGGRKEDHVGREQGLGASPDGGHKRRQPRRCGRAFHPGVGETHEAILYHVPLRLPRLAYGDSRTGRRGEHGGGAFSVLRHERGRVQGVPSHGQAYGGGRGLFLASRRREVRGLLGVRGRPGEAEATRPPRFRLSSSWQFPRMDISGSSVSENTLLLGFSVNRWSNPQTCSNPTVPLRTTSLSDLVLGVFRPILGVFVTRSLPNKGAVLCSAARFV